MRRPGYWECPVCQKGRKARKVKGVPRFKNHNRWDPQLREMVPCEGSGEAVPRWQEVWRES